jgi:hypothetical protein
MAVMVVVVAVVMVVAMVTVMAVMTVMTAAVHHVPTAATVAATMAAATTAAAVTAGVGIAGRERRKGNNDRCGESKECSALEHVEGSFGLLGWAHPRAVIAISLKPRLAAVLAITVWANATPDRGECRTRRKRP